MMNNDKTLTFLNILKCIICLILKPLPHSRKHTSFSLSHLPKFSNISKKTLKVTLIFWKQYLAKYLFQFFGDTLKVLRALHRKIPLDKKIYFNVGALGKCEKLVVYESHTDVHKLNLNK